MRFTRTRLTIAGAASAAVLAAGAGAAFAGGGGDEAGDAKATGPAADRARAAALRVTHGGTANEVEREDESGAAWEVEVTKPDGQTVDVLLNGRYGLIEVESDSDEGSDNDDTEDPKR